MCYVLAMCWIAGPKRTVRPIVRSMFRGKVSTYMYIYALWQSFSSYVLWQNSIPMFCGKIFIPMSCGKVFIRYMLVGLLIWFDLLSLMCFCAEFLVLRMRFLPRSASQRRENSLFGGLFAVSLRVGFLKKTTKNAEKHQQVQEAEVIF